MNKELTDHLGRLHAEDTPAVIVDGREEFWWHGKRHRLDGPAITDINLGVKEFWVAGVRHNMHGAAVTNVDGEEFWIAGTRYSPDDYRQFVRQHDCTIDIRTGEIAYFLAGTSKRHRKNGPAVVGNGMVEYWLNGERHRDNAPAVLTSLGNVDWYHRGVHHRIDGPAKDNNPALLDGELLTYENPGKYSEWLLHEPIYIVNGEEVTPSKYAEEAVNPGTSPERLARLTQFKNTNVGLLAASNPNCPVEAKIEYALIHGHENMLS